MFTVLIAEKNHLDNIKKYDLFLEPFINRKQMAFCTWNPEGGTFEEMVPELSEQVQRRLHWRIVLISQDEGMAQKNPFNIVKFAEPAQEKGETDEDYFERCFRKKAEAYAQASEKPLTRLMTYLCQSPQTDTGETVSGMGALYEEDEDRDYEYASNHYDRLAMDYYHKAAACKQELRKQILNGETVNIAYPQEIYCIAMRTLDNTKYELKSAWTEHVVHQYSRFYDGNMYFDKMRYLVMDVAEKKQKNYTYDYLRFLCSVLMLSGNDVPADSIHPFRVYELNCENDEKALSRLMVSYEWKLRHTEEEIKEKLELSRHADKKILTDKEVRDAFCSPISISLPSQIREQKEDLFVDKKKIGLASDRPEDEKKYWFSCRKKGGSAVHKMLKMRQRNLAVAVGDVHDRDNLTMGRVKLMNSFQIEDVKESINKNELEMIATCPPSVKNAAEYEKKMETYAEPVWEEMRHRMDTKTVGIVGGLIILIFFLCYVPMFVNNYFSDIRNMTAVIVLTFGATALLAGAGLLRLFIMRGRLRDRIVEYNRGMEDIRQQIQRTSQIYAKYLSHACSIMRSSRVLNCYYETEDDGTLSRRVLEKHICDLEKAREDLLQIFGMYMNVETAADPLLTEPYDYDFTQTVDYRYPVPFKDCPEREIGFIQRGTRITVPAGFVSRLTVTEEELYD